MAIFAVGYLASRKEQRSKSQDLILAGRNIPFYIGIFTMTATWVGGGYINGTAEAVADPEQGLIWAIAPWGYAVSLILGGIFFAGKMRSFGFTTMLDPFEIRYGKKVAALLFLPALVGEIFWSSAILTALGTTFGIVLGYDFEMSILISSIVAIAYTALGGLMAVAYTDVIQLICIAIGLVIALPFVAESSGGILASWEIYKDDFGRRAQMMPGLPFITGKSGITWLDSVFLLALGGIPWQVYFQRVLSTGSPSAARKLSFIAALGCLVMAVPSIWIGIAGATTDWASLGLEPPESYALTLPYVLQNLTPPFVATIGLAAVAAAVMSSVDSSILSASSMFYWNVYRPFAGSTANEKKVKRIVQAGILVIGGLATYLALKVQSVYALWFLCADFVYVLLFPQLTMALFFKRANIAGAIAGFAVGLLLRLGGGEESFGLPALLPFPETNFPFRSVAMVMSLVTIYVVSVFTGRWYKPVNLSEHYEKTKGVSNA